MRHHLRMEMNDSLGGHIGGPQAALLHVGRAVKWRRTSPHCLRGGKEVWVFPPASWIVTGNASRACPFETPCLHQHRPIWPMTGHHPLHLFPWEQVCCRSR